MGPDARQVFEEGVQIPITHLVREGVMNRDLLRIFLANSREPLQVEGDLNALVSALGAGQRRLTEMLNEFGMADIEELGRTIIAQSRAATEAAIAKLPRGRYSADMTIDGYGGALTLAATCTVEADRVLVDYAGTSPMSRFGINVVEPYTAAYTCFGLKCAIAPEIPNNAGSLAPFVVSAPPGSVLHAIRPAPVAARHIIGLMLPDVVFGCLAQFLPGGVPAEGGLMWNPYIRGNVWHDGTARVWESFFFSSGGTGARPTKDGLSATAFPAGTRAVQVEAAEAVAPIMILRKEFRPDSGGAGKQRGGLGQVIEIGSAAPGPFAVQAMFDRIEHPARGRDGGKPGAAGTCRLRSGGPISGMGLQDIPAGDVLLLELPGGGGIGDPRDRSIDAVVADVQSGLLSPAKALADYGIVADPKDGLIEARR
jgi:N-methylhydantoinase B